MLERPGHIIESLFGRYALGRSAGAGRHRQSGKGIAERQGRFAREWQPHLDSCKEMQRRWSEGLSVSARESLLVLGAGRLFDFEARLLAAPGLSAGIRTFNSAAFIDVDSGCLSTWQECKKQFLEGAILHFELLELTGRLVAWQQELLSSLERLRQIQPANRWNEALLEIRRIGRSEQTSGESGISPVVERLKLRPPSAVISLNLLSQLPLAWQKTIEENLVRVFGASYTAERENEWLEVYRFGAETILREHAALLCSLGADSILLFSDIDYVHPIDPFKVSSLEVLTWQQDFNQGDPAANLKPGAGRYCMPDGSPARQIEVIDALAGSQLLEGGRLGQNFPGYTIADSASWLWHIVPRSGRREPRPEVHRVAAVVFDRSDVGN